MRPGPKYRPAERVWDNVRFIGAGAEDCWEWDRPTFARPKLSVGGREQLASRVVWELEHGPIPAGLLVCHRCDNPSCVRPDHLFLGTVKDNAQDALSKGRLKIPTRSKLTLEDCRVIRERYMATRHLPPRRGRVTLQKLADEYGVDNSTIYHVVHRNERRLHGNAYNGG